MMAYDEEIEDARVPAAVREPLRKPLTRGCAGGPDVLSHTHGLGSAGEGRSFVEADCVQHRARHQAWLDQYE